MGIESKLAHHYLDGLKGIEIGGSAHNPFGLDTINVDYCDDMTTSFKLEEIQLAGYARPVDVVAPGDNLPFPDESYDFIVSSHVIEHFYNPMKTLREWMRVIKPGGYLFIICPHKDRTFDSNRPRTTVQELIRRDHGRSPKVDDHQHWSVFITQDFLSLCKYMNLNVIDWKDRDDKVGNGFTVVIQKPMKESA